MIDILNFQALVITIVLIAVVVVIINNKLNYLELGGIGFGIFLLIITFMDHVEKKHYIVKEEDEFIYVFPEEEIKNTNTTSEEASVTEEAESNLPLINKTTGPLDSLTPQELSKRLKYLYYATSNPHRKVSYKDYETHADKLINEDNSSLAPDDARYHNYLLEYYPELTKNQISTRDCLNKGFNKDSCYQHPNLFNNIGNESILNEGINQKNQHFINREDFGNTQNMYDKPLCSLMYNAPSDPNQIRLIDQDLCRGCTVGLCSSDLGCSQQNELFF